jgi:tetratricopeptide (TPR) repeat protein
MEFGLDELSADEGTVEVDPAELAIEVDVPAPLMDDLSFEEISITEGMTERTFESSMVASSLDELEGLPVGVDRDEASLEFELDPADEAVAESLGASAAPTAVDPAPTAPSPAPLDALAALDEEDPGEAPAVPGNLEDDLDEADFFVSQNLFEEARAILGELLARHPNHPLIVAKLRDLQTQMAPAPAAAPAATPVSAASDGDGGRRPSVIARALGGPDLDTHYDLGLAYKEMGLYDEAIREFALVREAPGRAVQCFLMIGLCHLERGQLMEAVEQFKAGLYVENISEQEALALYFELGAAYEELGDPREALYYFEKVQKRDPAFRDVDRRIEALGRGPAPSRGNGASRVARPVDREDSGDEAMRAIDSLGEPGSGDFTPA